MISREKRDIKQYVNIRKLSIGVIGATLSSALVLVNSNNAYADNAPTSITQDSNNLSKIDLQKPAIALNRDDSAQKAITNEKQPNAKLIANTENSSDVGIDNGVSPNDTPNTHIGGTKAFTPIHNADSPSNSSSINVPGPSDKWDLRGIADWHYGEISYNTSTKQLDVSGTGLAPHNYYHSTYSSIRVVSKDGSEKYKHEYIGDHGEKFSNTTILNTDDTIFIFQDEFNRIATSNLNLKYTNLASPKTFIYRVTDNGTLLNITDYITIKNNVNDMFRTSAKDALTFGLSTNDIDQVKSTILNNKCLTQEQKEELSAEVLKAKQLIEMRPSGLNLNEVKEVNIFSIKPNDMTNNEGRPMGNNMDRQDLGISMTKGSKIKIKISQTSIPNSSLVLDLIDSSSNNEQVINIKSNNDWIEVTANADNVPYIKTPALGTYKVEYQVVSGRVDLLPIFSHSTNQGSVQSNWDQTKSPYALMKSYNFQLQIPYLDIVNVANTDMQSLLNQYDNQLFKLYAELTGIEYNTSEIPKIRRYFAMPDKNGIGAAYYNSGKWIAINGSSVSSYLSIGWLTLHEIAHGYEIPSSTMDIIDNFNNVYGTIYQSKYTYPDFDSFNKDTWVYGGNRKNQNLSNLTKQVITEHKQFNQLGLGDRLIELLSLADYKGINSWTVFNKYHRMMANSGQSADDLGKDWILAFAKEYNVDLTPYFKLIGVPVDQVTSINMANASLAPLVPLFQLVSDNKINEVMKQLGWAESDHLKNTWSLVTSDDLAKTGLLSSVDLTINGGSGHTFILKNGSKVVETINIPQNGVDSYHLLLKNLPIGVYTLVDSKPGFVIDNPYVLVTEGTTNTVVSTVSDNVLNVVHDLYTDKTFTKLKGTATLHQIDIANKLIDQLKDENIKSINKDLANRAFSLLEQITLLGGNNVVFGTINDNNGSGILTIHTYPVQPHWAFGDSIYATIKIYNTKNEVVWLKEIKASQVLHDEIFNVDHSEGYKLVITHAEGSARLQANLGNEVITPSNEQTLTIRNGRLESQRPLLKLISKPLIIIDVNQFKNYDELIKFINPTIIPNSYKTTLSVYSGFVNFNREGTYDIVLLANAKGTNLTSSIKIKVIGKNDQGNDTDLPKPDHQTKSPAITQDQQSTNVGKDQGADNTPTSGNQTQEMVNDQGSSETGMTNGQPETIGHKQKLASANEQINVANKNHYSENRLPQTGSQDNRTVEAIGLAIATAGIMFGIGTRKRKR